MSNVGNSDDSGRLASTFTRLDAFQLFTSESKKINGRLGRPSDLSKAERICLITLALGHTLHSPLSAPQQIELDNALSYFISKVEKKYKDCRSYMPTFTKKNNDWLSKIFLHDIPKDLVKCEVMRTDFSREQHVPLMPGGSSELESVNLAPEGDELVMLCGSSEMKYEQLSHRQQLRSRNRLQNVLQDEPPKKLIKVFTEAISDSAQLSTKGRRDLEDVINECLTSPNRASEIKTKFNQEIKPYSAEEALGIMIDRKFNVETYKFLRQDLKNRGSPMFPPYKKVSEARASCYPSETLTVNEIEVSVSLQGLLEHTFKRIMSLYDNNINMYCEEKGIRELSCVFEGSWGFDGSTGQSLYKHKVPEDPLYDENTIFATTFIPLRIKENGQGDRIIWINPNPQSLRFCRPLHIQYRKETKDLTIFEKSYVEDQIRNLLPIISETSKGYSVSTTCELTLSVIDGKVYNIITDTNSQLRCPLCKITASQFNKLEVAFNKPINEEAQRHGLSPLHAYIRCLEFLLHLGYKNDPNVRKWRISKSSAEGDIVENRKKRIQVEIRDRMGLLVDVVRPHSGTTNDGNTARRVFSTEGNRTIFAEILEIEKWLVDDINTILVAMNSGLPIDSQKFGDFCKKLAYKYVAEYDWLPMTVTLHKILVHGQKIVEMSTLPVGVLSEQAGESRNKFWRYDREHHSRKDTRRHTMIDLFHRALESSDPIISHTGLHWRQRNRKRIPFSTAVINLLKPFDPPQQDDDDGDDDNDECPHNTCGQNEYTSVVINEIENFEYVE